MGSGLSEATPPPWGLSEFALPQELVLLDSRLVSFPQRVLWCYRYRILWSYCP